MLTDDLERLRGKQDLIDRFLEMAGFCEVSAAFSIDPEASEERRHEVVSTHWRELVRGNRHTLGRRNATRERSLGNA